MKLCNQEGEKVLQNSPHGKEEFPCEHEYLLHALD